MIKFAANTCVSHAFLCRLTTARRAGSQVDVSAFVLGYARTGLEDVLGFTSSTKPWSNAQNFASIPAKVLATGLRL
jgi:uncharacterized protein (DUF849 family)